MRVMARDTAVLVVDIDEAIEVGCSGGWVVSMLCGLGAVASVWLG